MTTTTRAPLYPMSIGSHEHGTAMHIMVIEGSLGQVLLNMAHFVRAEMSEGALWIRATRSPPIKVPGADFSMLEVAMKRFR